MGKKRDTQLFVDHQTEHTHLGGASLVQFDGALLELGFFIKCIPAKVDGTVAEIGAEFGLAGQVGHDASLEETNEKKELNESAGGDGFEGSKSVGDGCEGGSREVNVSRKTNSGLLDEVSDNTEHANTSVLDLNESEAVKLRLVTISDKAKGIEEAKRGLGTKLVSESAQGGRRRLLRDRGESGRSGEDGGEDSGFHLDS